MMGWRDNIVTQKKKVKIAKRSSQENVLHVINVNTILRHIGVARQQVPYKQVSKKMQRFLHKYHYGVVSSRFMGLFENKKFLVRNNSVFKKFRVILRSFAGRNASGKITVRHRGGGLYRSFIQQPKETLFFSTIPTKVLNLHNVGKKLPAKFGLCFNNVGVFSYMLAADKLENFSNVFNSNDKMTRQMLFSSGSRTRLRVIPTGSLVYNVELYPNTGPQLARSAGSRIKLMLKKQLHGQDYAGLLLPSKRLIYVPLDCQASLGVASSPLHKLHDIGLAGIRRKQGFRPSVRGVAMNPIDHHHGGGEGKTSSGPKPKTASGKIWRYIKTRSTRKEHEFKIFVSRMNKQGLNISSTKKYY